MRHGQIVLTMLYDEGGLTLVCAVALPVRQACWALLYVLSSRSYTYGPSFWGEKRVLGKIKSKNQLLVSTVQVLTFSCECIATDYFPLVLLHSVGLKNSSCDLLTLIHYSHLGFFRISVKNEGFVFCFGHCLFEELGVFCVTFFCALLGRGEGGEEVERSGFLVC